MLISRGLLALNTSYCLAQELSGSIGLGWAQPTCQGLNILAGEDSGATEDDLRDNSGCGCHTPPLWMVGQNYFPFIS